MLCGSSSMVTRCDRLFVVAIGRGLSSSQPSAPQSARYGRSVAHKFAVIRENVAQSDTRIETVKWGASAGSPSVFEAESRRAKRSDAETLIARDYPRCPILRSNGWANSMSFERRRRRIEQALREKQQAFLREHPEFGDKVDGTPLDENERGFYLFDSPYYLPTKRYSIRFVPGTMYTWFSLPRHSYNRLHKASMTAAAALVVRIARYVVDDDWHGLKDTHIFVDNDWVDRLERAVDSLTSRQRARLDIHKKELVPLPGIHERIFPRHQWPRAWLVRMSLSKRHLFRKESNPERMQGLENYDEIQSNEVSLLHMHYLVQAAHQLPRLEGSWPFVPSNHDSPLPKFTFGNIVLSKPLRPHDSWTEWKVSAVNFIALP